MSDERVSYYAEVRAAREEVDRCADEVKRLEAGGDDTAQAARELELAVAHLLRVQARPWH